MARNEFESEVGQLLRAIFPVCYRIDDVAFNRDGNRKVSSKPGDYWGVASLQGLGTGKAFLAEAKRVKQNRFPISNLKDHQREGLAGIESAGGFGWLFLNFRTDHKAGSAYWLSYWKLLEIERDLDRKSITPEHIPSMWKLARITGGWSVPVSHPLGFFAQSRPINLGSFDSAVLHAKGSSYDES